MLKKIPRVLSPDLVRILMEMGHGDEIILADANYPAASRAKRLVRADGIAIPELLAGLLELFPLDTFVACPVTLMEVDKAPTPPIWEEYQSLFEKEGVEVDSIAHITPMDFYERSETVYAIVATGETALYANILLRKGVVT